MKFKGFPSGQTEKDVAEALQEQAVKYPPDQ